MSPCYPFRGPNGLSGWLCTGRQQKKRCSAPGCGRVADFECDYPVTRRGKPPGTCSAPLCDAHAWLVPGATDMLELHYCPPHRRLWCAAKEQGK